MDELFLYSGLFWNAFIAATLLPAFSELALAGLLQTQTGHPALLFVAATGGNVTGSIVNWWLGARLTRFEGKRWFPFKKAQISKATDHFNRYGKWSLLFAWLPVIGDPLTLVAGVLRTPLLQFLLLVTLGKAARYGLILLIYFW